MIKLTFSIFIYSNKTNFFYQFFKILSFIYVKMPRDSWAKYYQNNKERLQKSPWKKKKKKSDTIAVKDTRISQKMENKSYLSIGKVISNEKKCLIIIRKTILVRKFAFFP